MLHKEGKKIVSYVFGFCLIVGGTAFRYSEVAWIPIWALLAVLFIFTAYFFRVPRRNFSKDPHAVIAPADGKVVAIETVAESEFLHRKARLVSIFMSPLNVHINWNPISGEIIEAKYQAGKYLVAWHPKSSTENERMSSLIQGEKAMILVVQIAGAMARRIINYHKKGISVTQGQELGFIRFGSRVDLYLPLEADIEVEIGDKVKGLMTRIARLK
ncbi:MAG: phosphatidylserine decarboxylase family protein [Bacteroidetes bacterium]|jgi:phosphatidylserine decarboxylase|nr:phosphatidylserine decarboxylase family protein [Bacteroidota bacterium]